MQRHACPLRPTLRSAFRFASRSSSSRIFWMRASGGALCNSTQTADKSFAIHGSNKLCVPIKHGHWAYRFVHYAVVPLVTEVPAAEYGSGQAPPQQRSRLQIDQFGYSTLDKAGTIQKGPK